MKKRISVALSFLMLLCVLTCTAVAYAEGDELAQVTGLKSGGTTATAITVMWDETENAEGYYVSLYKPETKKEAHYTTTDTTYKAVKLRWSTKYTFKVRAYKTVDGVKTYGEYSEALKISTKDVVAKPAVSGYCNLTSKPVVTWKKAKSAKKYVVYRSTKKDKGYKKIATLGEKARSYTDKSAKVHKTYYYKVRGWRKFSGQNAFSKYSAAVAIKAKKTVFVGDSVMEGVKLYNGIPGATYISKVGMGPYTFYENNYFSAGGAQVSGCEKLISLKPDRVFFMLGMNEIHYKSDKGVIEYYSYALEDLFESRKNVEVIILSAPPTKANSGSTIAKKPRLKKYNAAQKKMAQKYGCAYYDFTAPFKDSNGYLLDKYDGGDGCHWNTSSAKLFGKQMLKYAKSHK